MSSGTIGDILQAHRAGASPAETIARTYARIREHDDPAIFITLRDEKEVIAEAKALSAKGDTSLPLYGVPFAVKDNIDVGGMPTTAGCPAFAYTAKADATCVARLRAAGAIVIGKTNLDQFATGLVGVRSPYGIPRMRSTQNLSPADRAQARLSRSRPAWCRSRSAATRPAPAAFRQASAISLG